MAWELSWGLCDTRFYDTLDNYAERANAGDKTAIAWLVICFAENVAVMRDSYRTDLNMREYKRALKIGYRMVVQKQSHQIADAIACWVQDEIRTTDNGGFNVWACPFGCHTIAL